MKKSIIAVAVVSVLSLSGAFLYAKAQNPDGCTGYGPGGDHGSYYMHGPGRGRGYGHLYYMKDQLGLSEDQADKIAKIDSEFHYKYFKDRNNQEKINALRTEHRKAVESVLTPAQKKKWDELFKNRDGRGYGYNCPWVR
jgi:Spy/CpxP family protein refolding chaperone